MKCINKAIRILTTLTVFITCCTCLAGCGSTFDMSWAQNANQSNYNFLVNESGAGTVAASYASDLCVADEDILSGAVDIDSDIAAGLFDINNAQTLYAQNINEKKYPASMTKIMTALTALKATDSKTDQVLTADESIYVDEAGAQMCGIAIGDTMTLDQALHLMLINSANDAANLIAAGIGGTKDAFVEMMNKEAMAIGATNTSFVNPNGLHDDNHYTTAYDMYLIFNEAMKYDILQEIINMPSYSTVYHDKDGNEKDVTVNTTNLYLQDSGKAPSGVTVVGGKTGTTTAAGHCLILLARNTGGEPYIAVIMGATDSDMLYDSMNQILELTTS